MSPRTPHPMQPEPPEGDGAPEDVVPSQPSLLDGRLPPEMTPAERAAQMLAWTRSQEGLKRFLHLLPEGSTLDDALRLHRALRQVGRQPSRVMQEPDP